MTEMMTSMQGEGEDGPLLEGIDNKGGVPDVLIYSRTGLIF